MEEDFVGLLLADAGLTALVGNRVNWNVRPQGSALPSVALTLISGLPDYHAQGASGLVQSRVQVDVWASSFGSSIAVSRAIKTRLSGMRATHGNTQFLGVFVDSERQSHEEGSGGVWMHRVSMDFMVHFKERSDA